MKENRDRILTDREIELAINLELKRRRGERISQIVVWIIGAVVAVSWILLIWKEMG